MEFMKTDILDVYQRELNTHRGKLAVGFVIIAIITLAIIFVMPRPYTATATIYVDDSNILGPLMEGAAITTGIEDQARLAQEILYNGEFSDEIMQAAGYDISSLSALDKEEIIGDIKDDTVIANEFFGTANLVRISNTSSDPNVAYALTNKYTELFIEQSIINKQFESRQAFEFIQSEVNGYLEQFLAAEGRLTKFRLENSDGTIFESNARIDRYNDRIEVLELEFFQLETEQSSIESVLAGEMEVVRDVSEANSIRTRISSLQESLDSLRAVYHEAYPDIVQAKAQISDLVALLESEQMGDQYLAANEFADSNGALSLQQELRSQLAGIETRIESNATQVSAFKSLLGDEKEKLTRIMGTEAELTELTRDYDITQQFYNDMLSRMENARVSMHLDDEEQGVTFKIQEPAVLPLDSDGIRFYQLMIGSLIFAVGVPLGLLVVYTELDTRIRNESAWAPEWPPLLMVIPPLQSLKKNQMSDKAFMTVIVILGVALYSGAAYMKLNGYNPETLLEII